MLVKSWDGQLVWVDVPRRASAPALVSGDSKREAARP